MNPKMRVHWMILVLLASILPTSGCGTGERAEALFEPTPTPGRVRIGTPVEITIDESVGCFYGRAIENDVLIGQARQANDLQPVVVNLTTGEANRLDVEGIRLSTEAVRYVAQVRDIEPRANLAELLVHDLSEGKILTVAAGQLRRPYIFDNVVVWEEYSGGGRNIYGYDLSQKRHFTVAEGKGSRIDPQTDGTWVVYLFQDPEEQPLHTLRAHHIPTGKDFEIGLMPINPGDYPPGRFRISSNRIAWIGIKRGEIHLYGLETRTDEVIFKDERVYAVLGSLDMEDNLLIWGGTEQGKVGYDLVHHQMFDIPDIPEEVRGQTSSSTEFISEEYVVWLVEESDPLSRYLMTPPPPGEPMPTPPPELVAEAEANKCRRRLFVAPITRE
ncbi:MAG TPA: hypothetical protein ENN19_19080 [Chloroflexi bacterium]|nr:hypothetical protein [Chloroflexota bacterium]